MRGYTPVDLVTGTYLILTGFILLCGFQRIPNGGTYLLLHLGAIAVIALMGFLPRRGHVLLMFLRDSYPLWAQPLLYKEIGVINRILAPGFYDSVALRWESALFGGYPFLQLREWLPNHLFSEYLHFSYLAYYALVPILGFWLYLRGRDELFRVFATTVMLTFGVCYLGFAVFPVAGPFYTFPQPAPEAGVFPVLVHQFLHTFASMGLAFPSSHVAASVAVFGMTARFERPLIPLMGPLCLGIFIGTVYGGFHYGVDSLAGLVIGLGASLVGPRVHSFLLRRARLAPLRIRFPHLVGPLIAKLWGIRTPPHAPVVERAVPLTPVEDPRKTDTK